MSLFLLLRRLKSLFIIVLQLYQKFDKSLLPLYCINEKLLGNSIRDRTRRFQVFKNIGKSGH